MDYQERKQMERKRAEEFIAGINAILSSEVHNQKKHR